MHYQTNFKTEESKQLISSCWNASCINSWLYFEQLLVQDLLQELMFSLVNVLKLDLEKIKHNLNQKNKKQNNEHTKIFGLDSDLISAVINPW